TEVRFEAESDVVRVVKIYALTPNTYDILVRHEIHNLSSAPIQPSLYWQLERDVNEPPGGSSFYAAVTELVVYSDEDKCQMIDVSYLDKGRGRFTRSADNVWIGMLQHTFATGWVPAPRIQLHKVALRIGDNLYAIRTLASAGSNAPG